MRVPRAVLVVALGFASACGGTVATQPEQEVESEPAFEYSAIGAEFLPHSQLPPNLNVVLTATNPNPVPLTRVYPAGCPVRLRIYRPIDSTLVYDETTRDCALATPVSKSVEPGGSFSIGSGYRQMTQIAGDSIPYGRYRLVAVPGSVDGLIVEVEAGEVYLRPWPTWPAPLPQ